MIRFNIDVVCYREKATRRKVGVVKHHIGYGLSTYLEEHLARKTMQEWQRLCNECENFELCEHARRNPEQVKTDTYEQHLKHNAMLVTGYLAEQPALYEDEYQIALLEKRRNSAQEAEEWPEVMKITRQLGFIAGQQAGRRERG